MRCTAGGLALLALASTSVRRAGGDDRGNTVTVWDFVVVGAGTGGAACAASLADEGFDVLLLEAGKWDGEWLYNTDTSRHRSSRPYVWGYPIRLPGKLSMQNDPDLRSAVAAGRIVGGSSAVHGDVYDSPPEREFEYAGIRGWDGATVREALGRLEEQLSLEWVGEENLDDVANAQFFVIERLLNGLPVPHVPRRDSRRHKAGLSVGWQMFRSGEQHKGRHTSYSKMVPPRNGSAGGQRRLTVVAEALAARVLLEPGREPGQHEAVGVEWRRGGVAAEAFARHGVLLAAGAIGTPKVLMLSGIGDPLELQRLGVPVKVANREVGRELADHLAMYTWFLVAGHNADDPEWIDTPDCKAGEKFNLFFNLTGPLSGGDGRVDAEVRFFSSCNVSRKAFEFGMEAVLLHPESRGQVVVTSANPEALPSVDFPSLWAADYDRMEAIYARLGEALSLTPEDFATDKGMSLSDSVRTDAYLYQHMCCSARVAPRGSPGVCDEDLQVRGALGLFVADAAALPFTPSAHTSAPAMLMGELAASSAARLARGPSGRRPLPARAIAADEAQTPETREAALARTSAADGAAQKRTHVPTIPLRTGGGDQPAVQLPLVGLGTGTLSGTGVAGTIATFLAAGGRHLDLAVMYDNYADVRKGIQASGLEDLTELVLTWKVMPFGAEYVRQALDEARDRLGVASLDIALLHWPGDVASGKLRRGQSPPACMREEPASHEGVAISDTGTVHNWRACRLESYAALLEAQREGVVRAVGVSNFAVRHLDDLAAEGLPPPAVHQMEMHPMWVDDDLLSRSNRDGTAVQAYGCLGGKHYGAFLLRFVGFQKIAKRLRREPAQVILRWAIQFGASVITGGSTDAHIAQNLDLFGFELSNDDMEFLDKVDRHVMKKSYGPYPEEIV